MTTTEQNILPSPVGPRKPESSVASPTLTPKHEQPHKTSFAKVIKRLMLSSLVVGGGAAAYDYQAHPDTSIVRGFLDMFKNNDIIVSPSGIPHFEPSIPAEYITPTTTGRSPQELAKRAGYNIIKIDSDDTIGRTVFYDWRGGFAANGIGIFYQDIPLTNGEGGAYRNIRFITGSFASFEDIPESKDKYILLKDPQTNQVLPKIKVDFIGQLYTTQGMKPTSLSVENLSFTQDQALSLGVDGKLGYMPQWSENALAKILKPGDTVGVSTSGGPVNYIKNGEIIKEIQNTQLVAGSMTIRRFGGKGQIEKELLAQ